MDLLTSRLFLMTSATSDVTVSSHESNGPSLDIREIKTHMFTYAYNIQEAPFNIFGYFHIHASGFTFGMDSFVQLILRPSPFSFEP